MEKFQFYNSNDKLVSGELMTIEKKLYCYPEDLQAEIAEALQEKNIEEKLQALQEEEKKFFNKMQEEINSWQSIAEKIKILQLAKKYKEVCKSVEKTATTHNNWVEEEKGLHWVYITRISNKTYGMSIRVYECTEWDIALNKQLPYSYEVSYNLYTNTNPIVGKNILIKSLPRKKFETKEEALKYVEGRKKFFKKKYFKEEYQPIIKEFKRYFTVNGKLLEGYTLAEE